MSTPGLPTAAELAARIGDIRVPIDLYTRAAPPTLEHVVATWQHDTLHTHDGQPYMHRYYPVAPDATVALTPAHVRIHQFVASDPGRDLHDHPWDFTTTILAGSYLEHTPHGTHTRNTGETVHHLAEDAHRIELTDGPVWTLFTHGPARRRWGFHTPNGWIHWRDYPDAGHVETA